MKKTGARLAILGLTPLVLGLMTSCMGQAQAVITTQAPSGTVEVQIVFDPAGAPPMTCPATGTIIYSFNGTRTGNAPGAPAANVSAGVASVSPPAVTRLCSNRAPTFTFPAEVGLQQGTWEFSLTVTADGVARFTGTCSGVAPSSTITSIFFVQSATTPNMATCPPFATKQ
jgi:hypothetical protein